MLSVWLFSIFVLLMGAFSMTFVFQMQIMSFIFLQAGVLNMLMEHSNMSHMFCIVVILISVSVFFWARFYMKASTSLVFFFTSLLMFVTSMLILILSKSFMMIFLGWEGLGITSFILIIFYQNWSSFKGGLLTLLTNRLGDAVLIICFGYWVSTSTFFFSKGFGLLFTIIFFLISLTKSAQAPFMSWLPAAMAAPTPVSALVHSSTLVTAGIWLLIRFSQTSFLNMLVPVVGMFTLMIASMAALTEADGKKIVALSTLSQLGLMFTALSVGGPIICFFHLLTHALAKANLFLIIGSFIHSRASQQDVRFMGLGMENSFLFLSMLTSVLSLCGVAFTSGFFSKDAILFFQSSQFNSCFSFFMFLSIVSLTMAYCIKLVYLTLSVSSFSIIKMDEMSLSLLISTFCLSLASMTAGFFLFNNGKLLSLPLLGVCIWLFLVPSVLLKSSNFGLAFFSIQSRMIDLLNMIILKQVRYFSRKSSSTFLEGSYLTFSFLSLKTLVFYYEAVILLSLLLLVLVFI